MAWRRGIALAIIGVVLFTPRSAGEWGIGGGSGDHLVGRILAPSINEASVRDRRPRDPADEAERSKWLPFAAVPTGSAMAAPSILRLQMVVSHAIAPQIRFQTSRDPTRAPPLI
ncbi:MAG TPA: hypothetical protein VE174_00100 [Actinomycetota bacterium]|nr:hypothetical protein [Actinomycetota bacterium]